ncbi:hypothetical protein BDW02DRAFT_337679 [Decorospora gaudefroyi]|uniref:Uncharacterized protein n=1 Tax=Decorospora gaudefroyi TaxID=184978 RepID=A0A6A5KNN5_9PLEO|nr:hypothetical protein BDW02DRAFT_337679 [Decorospora gaudefroyi]
MYTMLCSPAAPAIRNVMIYREPGIPYLGIHKAKSRSLKPNSQLYNNNRTPKLSRKTKCLYLQYCLSHTPLVPLHSATTQRPTSAPPTDKRIGIYLKKEKKKPTTPYPLPNNKHQYTSPSPSKPKKRKRNPSLSSHSPPNNPRHPLYNAPQPGEEKYLGSVFATIGAA